MYFYPVFNASPTEDAVKFAHEFGEVLAMPITFEAIMCICASKNLCMSSFHGNFFVRSTDLLVTPTVLFIVLRTAVRHAMCYYDCHIRMIASAIPITMTSNLSDVKSCSAALHAFPSSFGTFLRNFRTKATSYTFSYSQQFWYFHVLSG